MTCSAAELPSGSRSGLGHAAQERGARHRRCCIAEDVTKRFGSLTVLDAVSLRLEPGTVHALLGENGAGKSTLVKCIMGFYHADGGRVVVGDADGAHQEPARRAAARHRHGLPALHAGREHDRGREPGAVARARARPHRLEEGARGARCVHGRACRFRSRRTRLVRQLAAGEKQKLEILKQLYLGSRIVILDEPTSVLTPDEADSVLGLLRDMAQRGELSVLMITHKFREVMAFADEVTVLRQGRFAGGGKVAELHAPRRWRR